VPIPKKRKNLKLKFLKKKFQKKETFETYPSIEKKLIPKKKE
jgi:hypothetical protein